MLLGSNINYRNIISRLDLKWFDKYKSMSNESMIRLIQEKDDKLAEEYFLRKNQYLVFHMIKNKYSKVGNKEDLIQEGMLGLLESIHDYNFNCNLKYIDFAGLCIKRKVINRIRWENSLKNNMLTKAVSYYEKTNDNSDIKILDLIYDKRNSNPLDVIIDQNNYNQIINFCKQELSELEFNSLKRFLEGKSYKEIGKDLRKNDKSIDNALQRVRNKLMTFLKKKEEL